MIRNRRNKSSWGFEPGKETEGAHLHAGFSRLMAGIVKQAYHDLCYGDLAAQVDAHNWLIEDAPIYCDALQIDADPLEPIESGKAKLAKRKLRK